MNLRTHVRCLMPEVTRVGLIVLFRFGHQLSGFVVSFSASWTVGPQITGDQNKEEKRTHMGDLEH